MWAQPRGVGTTFRRIFGGSPQEESYGFPCDDGLLMWKVHTGGGLVSKVAALLGGVYLVFSTLFYLLLYLFGECYGARFKSPGTKPCLCGADVAQSDNKIYVIFILAPFIEVCSEQQRNFITSILTGAGAPGRPPPSSEKEAALHALHTLLCSCIFLGNISRIVIVSMAKRGNSLCEC
ncbi:hypothetical protein CRG98_005013 [Punica granatum]|uniref:Uncharacterized protein n=1 Tax=Punica granatum TaxID=22663 RepID=A0A2I0L3G7_PUNGR|nr:hypothetical protein CRG98_005013 [Punica granatum]